MSRESKFHEWIEQQNREEKDRAWAKLQQREAERLAAQKEAEGVKEETEPVLPKKTSFSWRKWTAIAASSLAAVVLGVFAVVKFFPWDINVTDSSSSSEGGGRYFDAQSYDIVETQNTLKQYAEEIQKNLLFFDWYAETDYLKDEIWQLKDTKEIICYNEEIIDINTGCIVYIFVTESNTIVESFASDESTDRKTEIKEVEINWQIKDEKAIAHFEYEDYRYYLRVKDPIDETYILTLIEQLLA